MSVRTRACKSRNKAKHGYVKTKAWKTELDPLYVEVPTVSRCGRSYTKRVLATSLDKQPKTPIYDMVVYFSQFFKGLF